MLLELRYPLHSQSIIEICLLHTIDTHWLTVIEPEAVKRELIVG